MNIWILLCPGERVERLRVIDNRGYDWLLVDPQNVTDQPIVFDGDESRWLRRDAERFDETRISVFASTSADLSTVSGFAADRLVSDRVLIGNGSYISQQGFLAQDCKNGF